MTPSHFVSSAFRALCAAVLLALAGCNATPLPDPPSLHAELLRLEQSQPDQLTLTGLAGAITPAASMIRVTDLMSGSPGMPSVVTTTTSATGAFSVVLPGLRTDWLYIELLRAPDSVFLGAVTGAPPPPAVMESAAIDTDGDSTPNAIDCAPADPTRAEGAGCPAPFTCVADSDCSPGGRCTGGRCFVDPATCMPITEICGNSLDDDCDGLVDDAPCSP